MTTNGAVVQRAQWAHDCPPRFQVLSVVMLPSSIYWPDRPGWPTRLWVALPNPPTTLISHTFGRRTIDLPEIACLAATWREAMDYATTGKRPRPLDAVYPGWCGLDVC